MAEHRKQRLWFLLGSLGLLSTVLTYDFTVFESQPLAKYTAYPIEVSIFRSALMIAAAALLVLAIRPNSIAIDVNRTTFRLEVVATLSFITFVAFLVMFNPKLLERLNLEDGFVENMSVIFLGSGGLLMFYAWWCITNSYRLVRQSLSHLTLRFAPVAIGSLFLLISFEELSWGQRIIGFSTPDFFSDNSEGEVNLHNFYTWPSETLYYATACFAFVILPYAAAGTRHLRQGKLARFFIPPPEFVFIAAPVAFMQAEMWKIVPVQIMAWITSFILIDIARRTEREIGYLSLSVLTVCGIAQAIFLIRADILDNWLTEYKEAMIAFLCLVYAMRVMQLTRMSSNEKSPTISR